MLFSIHFLITLPSNKGLFAPKPIWRQETVKRSIVGDYSTLHSSYTPFFDDPLSPTRHTLGEVMLVVRCNECCQLQMAHND